MRALEVDINGKEESEMSDQSRLVEMLQKAMGVAVGMRHTIETQTAEIDRLRAELDALKAWKEEVEAQKPVGYWDPQDDMYFLPGFLLPHSEAKMEPRYARPVPAPSVPDVTDAMAFAFHRALTDGAIGQSEVDEIKAGLRAALAAAPKPEVAP